MMRILLLSAFALLGCSYANAQQVAIGVFWLPEALLLPQGIATGPDGNLWFTAWGWPGNGIGRLTPAGEVTAFSLPSQFCYPLGITAGPDGAMWFTENSGEKIGRITMSGSLTEYPLPSGGMPYWITHGPDGALWFTESQGNQIGRITTSGAITEYPLPLPNSFPTGITAGPDGALWFTELSANLIGRITTAGAITQYPLPSAGSYVNTISRGPDNALWFAEYETMKIGRITMAGVITEFPTPDRPFGITEGPDENIWYTDSETAIGRMTPAGVVTQFVVPTANAPNEAVLPNCIITGPDGSIWFTEYGQGIGQVVFPTGQLSISPPNGNVTGTLTFTGSGFAGNSPVRIYREGFGSAELAQVSTGSDGTFSVTVPAPASPLGPRLFLALGTEGGVTGAASFWMDSQLALEPQSGTPGTVVTVTGYGFPSLGFVQMVWSDPRTALNTATVDVNGTFNGPNAVTFTVPQDAAPGVYRISAGAGTGAAFTVN